MAGAKVRPEKSQGPALIWCQFSDEASAERAAKALLDETLIACANMLPPMRSLFVWRGQTQVRSEIGVLFKTDAALLPVAIARLSALHPDEEPAILGWRCDEGHPATVAWLADLIGS
jgi:periplasmic divalent cation tolerance protein